LFSNLSPDIIAIAFIIAIGSWIFTILLGIFVRIGQEWVKYLLLILFLLEVFFLLIFVIMIVSSPTMFQSVNNAINSNPRNRINGVFSIIQCFIHLWTIILLFTVPKTNSDE